MALHMVLVMLSLLPLLEAQNPEHTNITIGKPITNETLSWLKSQILPQSCGKYSRRLSNMWAWMNQKSYLLTGKRIGAVSRRSSSLSLRRRPRMILRKTRHELSSLNSMGCPHAHPTPIPRPVYFDSISATIKVW
ncbi:alpha-1-acid glycoprotein 1 isoform X2 [Arvicanthis niloticus]|uniref:alpha-1-acid glycoprotein 1 isoform X2 n=1 Tax=Arvicanthis niloticus TaxID=61156 RepID=UPI001486B79E|nr:alpha-1-acid glycoprotein 1 isoform X2 [Arvicanthis niloticus]